MKHSLAAFATAVLASLVSSAPGAAAASVSFAVYQTERQPASFSCPSPSPAFARVQSASFNGLAVGAGILTDTICFTGPVSTANATDTIAGGTWSLGGPGIVRGTAGIFCPSGTIHWDASGLRATVNAPAAINASTCAEAASAVILRGTWTRSTLTAYQSTFVGTLTRTR